MKIIAPSILSADFSKLGEEIKAVEKAGADWIHADVMDGHFVPNITIGPFIVEAVSKITQLPIDVHLMIEEPDRYIPDFIKAGANWISVHAEATVHLHRTIQLIKESGVRAGVALNPATPLSSIESLLEDLDYVVVMSVNPGFGGQSFIRSSLDKLRRLRTMIQDRGLSTLIQIDGGVSRDTIEEISLAGVDSFVTGSALFGSPDYNDTISYFREKTKN
ncbi:ribulose-phosphate 3-epimerase [Desulfosarcina sp. BuS5]|uniref:ribulose-phosphate 3-epimerase n=1 Tax=Desulfosarcina sp. BuS5 TaxID=933262 RepID=UPI000482DC09|nr:ribulose-phosphate 3-epimerase [Desulfosarcina sp. BuS5]WDN88537.1 ribulose-phosphate 3-epimerase [Desulfosarcina sp. BuS5]